MEEIPQPSTTPYRVGDCVRVYLHESDCDAKFHRCHCKVIAVSTDDLGAETGRELDSYRYDLRDVNTQKVLPWAFRHYDLVPADS
jgi:hypothetical protein